MIPVVKSIQTMFFLFLLHLQKKKVQNITMCSHFGEFVIKLSVDRSRITFLGSSLLVSFSSFFSSFNSNPHWSGENTQSSKRLVEPFSCMRCSMVENVTKDFTWNQSQKFLIIFTCLHLNLKGCECNRLFVTRKRPLLLHIKPKSILIGLRGKLL